MRWQHQDLKTELEREDRYGYKDLKQEDNSRRVIDKYYRKLRMKLHMETISNKTKSINRFIEVVHTSKTHFNCYLLVHLSISSLGFGEVVVIFQFNTVAVTNLH